MGGAPPAPGFGASRMPSGGISFSGPEWVTPLSPLGGILLSCVAVLYLESPPSVAVLDLESPPSVAVLYLESPPSSGCSASLESIVVSCEQGLPLAQCYTGGENLRSEA